MDIEKEARRIISLGNGFGVPCKELLLIMDEKQRKLVWRKIVEIGQTERRIL